MLKKQTVVILGAGGQLAADLHKVSQINEKINKQVDVICLDHKKLDVTDKKKVFSLLASISPNIVINTAAYHKVDEIEEKQSEAFLINTIAQKNLAEYCASANSKLVFFSSDYVFGLDKKRNTPYKETDLVSPINTYGISKAAAELMVKSYCSKHFIIRTAGLFGSTNPSGKGENFVELMIRLAKNGNELHVVNDQIMSPTYTANLAQNVFEILFTEEYGTYHMTSEGQCSWWDFATEIFKQLHLKTKCLPVDSNFFHNAAKRPSYSVLENYNLKKMNLNKMLTWQESLSLYLKEKNHL